MYVAVEVWNAVFCSTIFLLYVYLYIWYLWLLYTYLFNLGEVICSPFITQHSISSNWYYDCLMTSTYYLIVLISKNKWQYIHTAMYYVFLLILARSTLLNDERTVSERRTHGQRTLNASWAHGERKVSERKNELKKAAIF